MAIINPPFKFNLKNNWYVIKSRIILLCCFTLNSCLYLYCLAFTADWLFYLKASHARGKTERSRATRAQDTTMCARSCAPLHYVFSPTVTTSFPRSNDKSAVFRGRRRLRGCWASFRNWDPVSGVRCLTFGRKTVQHPLLVPSLTQLSHWPPVFYSWTPYSTVLYLGHCVSFFLEYIMLQNAPLSYFLKWLATEAEFCCKNRQSRTFCNAHLPASKPSDGEEFQRWR